MRKVADGGCDSSNETNEQPIQIIDEKQNLIIGRRKEDCWCLVRMSFLTDENT